MTVALLRTGKSRVFPLAERMEAEAAADWLTTFGVRVDCSRMVRGGPDSFKWRQIQTKQLGLKVSQAIEHWNDVLRFYRMQRMIVNNLLHFYW